MQAYILRRALILLPTLFGITLVAFFLIRMVPGDPVRLMLGERGASPETYARMKANLGLDQPLTTQYLRYVRHAFTGDLGVSIVSQRPVQEEFLARLPATLELGLIALFFAVMLGIPIGVLAAVKRNTWFDYCFMGGSLVGYSMPIFWWGLILILIFSVQMGLTPVSGRMGVAFDIAPRSGFLLIDTWLSGEGWPAFRDAASHLILPSIALGTIPLATFSRMTRSSILEVLGEDYIRTARAKGLPSFNVIFIHALRNALIPIATSIGLIFGTVVCGAILTETIFSWPGIGKWLLASVTSRDYPVIQGGLLVIATLIVFINLAMDIVYALINPRMRSLK